MGKGVLVTPTIHGNLLVGPTAEDTDNKEGINTTREGLASLSEKASHSVKNLPMRQVITSFAGLRAHEDNGDFIIGEAADAPGFFDACWYRISRTFLCTSHWCHDGQTGAG